VVVPANAEQENVPAGTRRKLARSTATASRRNARIGMSGLRVAQGRDRKLREEEGNTPTVNEGAGNASGHLL